MSRIPRCPGLFASECWFNGNMVVYVLYSATISILSHHTPIISFHVVFNSDQSHALTDQDHLQQTLADNPPLPSQVQRSLVNNMKSDEGTSFSKAQKRKTCGSADEDNGDDDDDDDSPSIATKNELHQLALARG
ncbi:unnamed protein product, partial [Ectocarpus sp. 13 AM-2016]